MKKLIVIMSLIASNFAMASNLCSNGDLEVAVKAAGGWESIQHIDLQYDLVQLIDSGAKRSDIDLGRTSFGSVYSGKDGVTGHRVVCTRITGQGRDSACQFCAVLNN